MLVDKTKENVSRCLCMNCPSYTRACQIKNAPENMDESTEDLSQRTHYEKMFCAFEKSNCIHIDRGCICDRCLVHKQYNLHHCDYCLETGGVR